MFRSLFNFTQQEQQHTPIIGTGATPILGGGSRRGSGGASGSVNGHFGTPAHAPTSSFESRDHASSSSHSGTPKVNYGSPRFSQTGAPLQPVTTNGSSFSDKLPTWSTVSGNSPPTLVSANMARGPRLQTPPSRDGSLHPFQNYSMDTPQDNVFRITQTHDVEVAPPSSAHFF